MADEKTELICYT